MGFWWALKIPRYTTSTICTGTVATATSVHPARPLRPFPPALCLISPPRPLALRHRSSSPSGSRSSSPRHGISNSLSSLPLSPPRSMRRRPGITGLHNVAATLVCAALMLVLNIRDLCSFFLCLEDEMRVLLGTFRTSWGWSGRIWPRSGPMSWRSSDLGWSDHSSRNLLASIRWFTLLHLVQYRSRRKPNDT